jgi:hypothetical protein
MSRADRDLTGPCTPKGWNICELIQALQIPILRLAGPSVNCRGTSDVA